MDDAGEIRALLDTGQGEHVSLSFFGGGGQELATVGVMPDGFSTLILNDGDGRESVKATGGGERSDTVVVLKDGDERTRLQLGVSDAGEPALALADEDGDVRVQTYLSAEGSAVLTIKDGDGGANVSVLVGSGDAAVVVADETDTERVGMLAQAGGDATLAVMDGEGSRRSCSKSGPTGSRRPPSRSGTQPSVGAQIVSGILIGAVVAIAAALVNYRLGVKRDAARWDRED